MNTSKPLIYSCSGCSSAAQMANYLAVRIDRAGIADMSCIAGVGGGVRKLVRTASSGRKIIVIDGCPLACSRACLSQHDLVPDLHIDLSTFDVSKKEHEDFDLWEADEIFELLKGKLMDESYGSSGLFTFIDHS
ncbi:MAG: putative zinc-binding protein [Pedobacter sp.]